MRTFYKVRIFLAGGGGGGVGSVQNISAPLRKPKPPPPPTEKILATPLNMLAVNCHSISESITGFANKLLGTSITCNAVN